MSQLRLHEVRCEAHGQGSRVVGTVFEDDRRHELVIAAPAHRLSDAADAFVPPLLLRAMRTGREVVLEPPVSARLLGALPQAQDILCSFEPRLRRATVTARSAVVRPAAAGNRAISFFSGGVDSYYTVLKHRAALEALLFVHGFDIPLADTVLREQVASTMRGAAAALGLPLVELEINLRPFLEDRSLPGRMATWGMTQGAALGAIALALGGSFDRVLIPSGSAYGDLFPWGTHPLLDPLWSSETVAVEHDGCEARRLQKVGAVARDPVALRTLRVCFKNPEGAYNCGRCGKCLRTMLQLRVHGALDRCPVFEQPLDLRLIDGPPLQHNERLYLEDMRRQLQATGRDRELLAAIERRLRSRHLGYRLRRLLARELQRVTTRLRDVGVGRTPAAVSHR